MSNTEFDYDEVVAKLGLEFIDSTQDLLNTLNSALIAFRDGGYPDLEKAELVQSISRECHNIKGSAGSFGFPLIGLVCQRLEDYLSNSRNFDSGEVDDIQSFLDRIGDILDGTIADDDKGTLIRDLPRGRGFDVETVDVHDVEVLLVMPKGTATTIVRRELEACGYSVNNISDPFRALEFAVRAQPDFVVLSPVLDHFNGVELARALRAMPTTHRIPLIVVSSLDKNDRSLKLLPPQVPVVRKGEEFSDDFAAKLADLEII